MRRFARFARLRLSGSAPMTPAPEPRYKTRPGKWYTPPAETPLYSAIPRATRQYWALLTKAEQAFVKLLTDERWAKQNPDKSWESRPPGMTALAKELECDRSTIVRMYHAITAKHCIRTAFDFYKGTRKYKAKRIHVYAFADALARRRKDPDIALTNDKRVVFRGRGRKPMTPADAHAWRVQLDRVPEFQESDAAELEDELDETANIEQGSPAPQAAPSVVEMPAPPVSAPDPILEALVDVVTVGAPSERDAGDVSRSIDASIPRETVAEWVRDIAAGRRKVNPREAHSVGYFLKRLPDYLARHRLTEQRAANERHRAARIERDARINRLASLLQEAERCTDPVERDQYGEFFANADPAELAAARSALADSRSRNTG